MSTAQRQGFHITPAHMRLVLAALRFYLAARTWLAEPHTDSQDDAPRRASEKYTGPPATIADLRRSGLVACTITCEGANCFHSKRVTLDGMSLDEATPIPDIAKRRGFRCQRCGSRRVRVSPDWTDHDAQGNGRQRGP